MNKKHPQLRKIPICIAMPRWLVEWMREQDTSQPVLIEEAMREKYKIEPNLENEK